VYASAAWKQRVIELKLAHCAESSQFVVDYLLWQCHPLYCRF